MPVLDLYHFGNLLAITYDRAYRSIKALWALKIRSAPRSRIAPDMSVLSCLLARKAVILPRTGHFRGSSLVLISDSYKHNPQCKNYLPHYQN
jgi:hypothetical protein